jgi:hypothetical protein
VLVECSTEMDMTFEDARRAILRSPEQWLGTIASAAHGREEQLLADIGFDVAGVRLKRQAVVEVLNFVWSGPRVVLLIRWRSSHAAGLFPVFEGSLEILQLDRDRSRLSVSGEYQPPGGAAGRVGDRALLHRVAKATVKDFVERASAALPALARNGTRGDGPGPDPS